MGVFSGKPTSFVTRVLVTSRGSRIVSFNEHAIRLAGSYFDDVP